MIAYGGLGVLVRDVRVVLPFRSHILVEEGAAPHVVFLQEPNCIFLVVTAMRRERD